VRSGNRMALENIRERLELAFPGRAAVEVADRDALYRVTLRFPVVTDPRRRPAAVVTARGSPAENCRP